MSATVCIEFLVGPDSSLRRTYRATTLTFGRGADCDIIIDSPAVSRHHGELRFEDNRWALLNHSPNGTTVNGRKIHAQRPRELKEGDVIGVGKDKLLTMIWGGAGEAPQEIQSDHAAMPDSGTMVESGEAHDEASGEKMSRRAKVWVGIGVYMAVMLVVALVVIGMRDSTGSRGSGPLAIVVLTDAEMAAAIRVPLTRQFDERLAAQHLAQARAWYDRADTVIDGLYTTYQHYQLALAYANRAAPKSPEDHLRFKAIEQKLINKITNDYHNALAAHRLRDWPNAEKQWRNLAQAYRATESPIYANIQTHLKQVIAQRPVKRGFN